MKFQMSVSRAGGKQNKTEKKSQKQQQKKWKEKHRRNSCGMVMLFHCRLFATKLYGSNGPLWKGLLHPYDLNGLKRYICNRKETFRKRIVFWHLKCPRGLPGWCTDSIHWRVWLSGILMMFVCWSMCGLFLCLMSFLVDDLEQWCSTLLQFPFHQPSYSRNKPKKIATVTCSLLKQAVVWRLDRPTTCSDSPNTWTMLLTAYGPTLNLY